MRWIFSDSSNAAESEYRATTIAKIDAWWREFERREADLRALFRGQSQWDLPEWMHEHLHAVDENLMWEFGPAVKADGHRLVITPEIRHDLRPLVQSLLKRAPKINGWEFQGARLPENLEDALAAVGARANVKIAGGRVQLSLGDHRRIDMNFILDGDSIGKRAAQGAAFILAETLLGEDVLNKWVGEINGASSRGGLFGLRRKPATADSVDLDGLRTTVESLIASVRDQLPIHPFHSRDLENAQYTVYEGKLSGPQANDFAGESDVVLGSAIDIDLIRAATSDPLFCSERFSRCNERFAFLKFDFEGLRMERRLEYRTSIEDVINSALVPPQFGCAVGAAIGVRYGYVNLALHDVTQSIKSLRATLRKSQLSKRSWIQSFDACWGREWVGVYNDSPEPPFQTEND